MKKDFKKWHSKKAQSYWTMLKSRLKEKRSEVVTKCDQLKMQAADGKSRFPRFRAVENHDAEHNQYGDAGDYIKNYIVHKYYFLLCIATTKMIVTTAPIIRYAIINWFIKIYLANLTLAHKVIIAIVDPNVNAVKWIGPAPVGMKNPITVEATKILDKSEKYLESVCNWLWFSCIYRAYQAIRAKSIILSTTIKDLRPQFSLVINY